MNTPANNMIMLMMDDDFWWRQNARRCGDGDRWKWKM